MQLLRVQNGAVLLLILLLVLLGASAWMLNDLREQKTVFHIADQHQTAQVLAQAKEALIGFAATYAESHEGQLAGYLPCPDYDGDGDADSACSKRGFSVVGRFPWKTLGLPPLRDGSGECLWYAVSGNFKDKYKSKITATATKVKTLTSDDDGLLLVKDAHGSDLTGVIAVVFAPGQMLSGQNRADLGTGVEMTECGSISVVVDNVGDTSYPTLNPINSISNYLERYENLSFEPSASGKSGFFAADNDPDDDDTLATFIKAPLTRDNNGQVTFNDNLVTITPEDFVAVYKMMELSVAKRVSQCLSSYAGWQQYKDFFEIKYVNAIGDIEFPSANTYRATYTTQIEEYVTDKLNECSLTNCLETCIKKCDEDTDCIDECTSNQEEHYRRTAINYTKKYPWPANVIDVDDGEYTDDPSIRFGRIPDVLSNNSDEMLDNWSIIESERCFDENDSFNAYEWSWWDEWKERVFYAVDDDYTPNTIYFWIKAVKKSTETQAEFNLRKQTLTTSTFAKITDPTKAPADVLSTDWNLESFPSAGLQTLQLNDDSTMKNANFLVFVAGREFAFQSRQLINDKKDITNYLEDENTSPSDELFERKPLTLNFNDVVCKDNSDDCGILY